MRVLVDDIKGDVSDTKAGWKDAEDNKASNEWCNTPSLVTHAINLRIYAI